MLKRVIETISRYSMFAPGQRVGVAVSGGADSVCLLRVLLDLGPHWALRLAILHVDHCLRGEESAKDAQFVRELADKFGLPFYLRRVDVGRLRAENGENLEQAGRKVRHEFFLRLIQGGEVDRVALGHTRSDQAETVLFRLLRGAGTAGISGIRPVTDEGFVRPLIEVERRDVEEFLRERRLEWREDSSNQDPVFVRNRIRYALLPALSRDWNPALAECLARMAVISQEDEDYWRSEIGRVAALHLVRKAGAVLVKASVLPALPAAVGRRLIRHAIFLVKGDLRQVDFDHVDQVLSLALRREGDGRVQLPSVDVMRSFDWIRFAPLAAPTAESRNYRIPLTIPGEVVVPGAHCRIRLELMEETQLDGGRSTDSRYNMGEWELDWNSLPRPLELRNWRPGDQYQPVAQAGEERIKLLFQKARIPLWERRSWPVIASGERIVWSRRFGPAVGFVAKPDSRPILKVGEIDESGDSTNLT